MTTEKKIADCFSRTMHARRGFHALACSNYFSQFGGGGGGGGGVRVLELGILEDDLICKDLNVLLRC